MLNDSVKNILNRDRPRILAFGSSNTQRRIPGMHWFDLWELAYNQNHEKPGFFLNAGIGGETVIDLLNRFETEALPFQPHLALITIGGNDANPESNFTTRLYGDKLSSLIESFQKTGILPVLQTYYAPDPRQLAPGHGERLAEFMAIQKKLAREYDIPLVDQFSRWCQFRENHNKEYQSLMLDGLHVNETGNLIMGFFLVESFGLSMDLGNEQNYTDARRIYERMKE